MRSLFFRAFCVMVVLFYGQVTASSLDQFERATVPFLVAQTQDTTKDTSSDEAVGNEDLVTNGRVLFEENCSICHAIDEKIIGPPLRDVHKRRPEAWMIRFIRNSQKVIQSGDEYAVQLYEEYGKTQMTAFDFSDEEILSIIDYIKSESEKSLEVTDSAGTSMETPSIHSDTRTPAYLFFIIGGIFLLLVLFLVILSIVLMLLRRSIADDKTLAPEAREEALEGVNWRKFLSSYGLVGFAVFLLCAVLFKMVIDGLYTVGVQQYYEPTQPIAFSHKLHAGTHKIDCNYCHTGVRKSKHANIPSANICMNCHNEIKKDSPEVQKIYTALSTNTPIEWVRVHNLPDLAYFDHAQHVAVGKVACQTCHGPVEEMEVVYQHANLTMGWCVNCHRETAVQTKDNQYYERLLQFHEEKGIKAAMNVQDIGGLECARCHY